MRTSLFVFFASAMLVACEATPAAKSPTTGFDPNAPPPPSSASTATGIAPLPSALASAPPPPQPPKLLPPSTTVPWIWDYDGKSGEIGKVQPPAILDHQRMMFLRNVAAMADCSNVETNAVLLPNKSGACLVLVSDVEMKAVGQLVSISVGLKGGPSYSFPVRFVGNP